MINLRHTPASTIAALALALCASGCGRDIGTVDLHFLVPKGENETPLKNADELRVAVDYGGDAPWETKLPYEAKSIVSFEGIPAEQDWVIAAELFRKGSVRARGQSRPFRVNEGGTKLELYVAFADMVSYGADFGFSGSPRGGHTAVTLDDGRVLLVGGASRYDFVWEIIDDPDDPEHQIRQIVFSESSLREPVEAADLFDPTTGRLVQGGNCLDGEELCLRDGARIGAAIGRTALGDVLVAGGGAGADRWPSTIERLASGALTFTPGASLNPGRIDATLVQIPEGALVIGGRDIADRVMNLGVILGPSGAFDREIRIAADCPRARATAAVASEVVFLFGGVDEAGNIEGTYALIDVAPTVLSGECHPLRGIEPRIGAAAAVIRDRFVVITGGLRSDGTISNEVDVFDAQNRLLCRAGAMRYARYLHATTAIADDRVFVVGGAPPSHWVGLAPPEQSAFNSYEILDIDSVMAAMWSDDVTECADATVESVLDQAYLPEGRAAPTATTLRNGMVLIAGGFDVAGDAQNEVMLYVP